MQRTYCIGFCVDTICYKKTAGVQSDRRQKYIYEMTGGRKE